MFYAKDAVLEHSIERVLFSLFYRKLQSSIPLYSEDVKFST